MPVNIKSRSRQKFDVNLTQAEFDLIPGGTSSKRLVQVVDPVSGEAGLAEQTFQHPPVITFRPGETLRGLPTAILQNPTIRSMTDRSKGRATLVVV